MGKYLFSILIIACVLLGTFCNAQTTIKISDPRLKFNENTLFIYYDILDGDSSEKYVISVDIVDEDGTKINAKTFEGDIGEIESGGYNKRIIWDLEADNIFIEGLRNRGLYDSVWQAGATLLPVQSVGVMGDERTYENTVVLRAVNSTDGMTADWSHLPYEFLAAVSSEIINRVRGINRVVYDISSKPPATIEWE